MRYEAIREMCLELQAIVRSGISPRAPVADTAAAASGGDGGGDWGAQSWLWRAANNEAQILDLRATISR